MNVIKFTHQRITSLIITHIVNIARTVELVVVCVSINPIIAHSVFVTVGCCVNHERVTSFEQISEKFDNCGKWTNILLHQSTKI